MQRIQKVVLALLAAQLAVACVRAEPPAAAPAASEEAAALGKAQVSIALMQAGQGPARRALPVAASAAEAQSLLAAQPALQAFLSGAGKGWTVSFDRRSGQPMLLQGPGIAWVPGAGNTLDVAAELGSTYGGLGPAARVQAVARAVESKARGLLAKSPMFATLPTAALALDRSWSGSPDAEGATFFATFRQAPSGIDQPGARLTFVIRHGNLVAIHAEGAAE